ncbi:MAG: hypothetical protein LVR00_06540 [Rhabdochlamydiaceae bacterium]|jgi:type III secretion protein L
MNQLILPLALKAAKKIVGKELETHPDAIVSIVMQALSPAMQNHRITIWINKADKDVLERKNLHQRKARTCRVSSYQRSR